MGTGSSTNKSRGGSAGNKKEIQQRAVNYLPNCLYIARSYIDFLKENAGVPRRRRSTKTGEEGGDNAVTPSKADGNEEAVTPQAVSPQAGSPSKFIQRKILGPPLSDEEVEQKHKNELVVFFATLRTACQWLPTVEAANKGSSNRLLADRGGLKITPEQAEEFMTEAFKDDALVSHLYQKVFLNNKALHDKAFPNKMRASIMAQWMRMDEGNNGNFTYGEARRLCEKGLFLPTPLTKRVLYNFEKSNERTINYAHFERYYIHCTSFRELNYVFDEAVKNQKTNLINYEDEDDRKTMSKNEFIDFIRYTQGETVDETEAERRMMHVGSVDAKELTRAQFQEYLSQNEYAALFNYKRSTTVHEDMTRPLCEYYINSSNNSFLTGGQLKGESSSYMIARVLQEGVRCLDLECRDGNNGPVVNHGHTENTPASFTDCVSNIRDNAFVHSTYPVILSLNVRASTENQEKMVSTLKEVLGDLLFTPTWPPGDKPTVELTPKMLQRKVLIHCRRGNPSYMAGMDKDEDELDRSCSDPAYTKMMESVMREPRPEIADSLAALVSIEAAGYKGVSKMDYLSEMQPYHCTQFTEKAAKKAMDENLDAMIKLNGVSLTRVYPTSARSESTNFSPDLFWKAGIQMASINYQARDSSELKMNRSFFADNGNSGYMLKPAPLRPPFAVVPAGKSKRNLTIEIISAFCLPKSAAKKAEKKKEEEENEENEEEKEKEEEAKTKGKRMDPCVKVFVKGPGVEGKPRTTKPVPNSNGFHPVWRGLGNNEFKFLVPQWEVSFLFIQIYDNEDLKPEGLVGENIFPMNMLTTGVRRINIQDARGNSIPGACLMCNVKYEFLF